MNSTIMQNVDIHHIYGVQQHCNIKVFDTLAGRHNTDHYTLPPPPPFFFSPSPPSFQCKSRNALCSVIQYNLSTDSAPPAKQKKVYLTNPRILKKKIITQSKHKSSVNYLCSQSFFFGKFLFIWKSNNKKEKITHQFINSSQILLFMQNKHH